MTNKTNDLAECIPLEDLVLIRISSGNPKYLGISADGTNSHYKRYKRLTFAFFSVIFRLRNREIKKAINKRVLAGRAIETTLFYLAFLKPKINSNYVFRRKFHKRSRIK